MANIIDKYLFELVNIKNTFLGRFAKKYYSQSGEDIILSKIFSNKKSGFFVDVGAYHPFHYSNTYLLYKKGWIGINIDPNQKSIDLFNKYRKKDINIKAGISKNKKELDYYIFNHQSCNTFSKEQKDQVEKKSFMKLLGKEKVTCYPLKEILIQHIKNKKIDLLNVDVEGLDLEVLESNDWNKFKPSVVVVENSDFNIENPFSDEIYKFMKEKGYKLYATTGLSIVFVEK